MKRITFAGLLVLAVLVGAAWGHQNWNLATYARVFADTDGHNLASTHVVDPPGITVPDVPPGYLICNTGALGSQEFDLPPAAAGLQFTFACSVAQNIVVDPAAGDQILSLTNAAGDSITGGAVGACVKLVALDGTNWFPVHVSGTWTDTN
jgi:hypothetical protein